MPFPAPQKNKCLILNILIEKKIFTKKRAILLGRFKIRYFT